MAVDLAIIILLGLFANAIFKRIKLPGLLGMLIVGVSIGPYGLNILKSDILNISADLRKIALIIILLRAGLGISKESLKGIGRSAIKLSFIPGLIEGFAIALASMKFLGFSFIQGGILGFIIAAVSPAVVVPQMLILMEKRIGTDKNIPTLILAGASIDDIVAITIFSTFLGLYSGSQVNLGIKILEIPLAIILGIAVGIIIGSLLIVLFKNYPIRNSKKVLIILGAGILLSALEDLLQGKVELAGLLGVMTIGFIIFDKAPDLGKKLSVKFNKVWVFAEIFLFVLVGAEVNIHLATSAGKISIILILIGLLARSIGVLISLIGSDLNLKERLFCIVAYVPKATVQAAIGSVPLSLGVASGDIILAISVLSIIITAPLGAIGISKLAEKLLVVEQVY